MIEAKCSEIRDLVIRGTSQTVLSTEISNVANPDDSKVCPFHKVGRKTKKNNTGQISYPWKFGYHERLSSLRCAKRPVCIGSRLSGSHECQKHLNMSIRCQTHTSHNL